MKTDADPPRPLLTVADVMAYLKVSDWWVRQHAGEIGGRMVGGLLRFDPTDVEAYLSGARVTPVATVHTAPAPKPTARQWTNSMTDILAERRKRRASR